jgi:hypothetical protein
MTDVNITVRTRIKSGDIVRAVLLVGPATGAGKTGTDAGALIGALILGALSSEVGPEIRMGAAVGISVTDGVVAGAVGVATPSHVPGVNVVPFTTSFREKYWNGPPRPIF